MEARKNISEQMKAAARNAESKPFEGLERVWERVAARLDEEEEQEKPVVVPFFSQRKIAAIAAGLLLVGLGTAYMISRKNVMPVADNPSTRVAVPHAAPSAGVPSEAAATFDTPARFPVATPVRNEPVRVKVIRAESVPGVTQADGIAAMPEPAGKEAPYEPPAPGEQYIGGYEVVSAKPIENTPVSDITKAIEGAAPGVQVTSGNGRPGSSSSLQVRGRGSLSASANPLIVVDGAPFEGDITSINPADIANMSILKDTQAAGLYGARGSNGVIVIVTKKTDTVDAGTKVKKKHKIWDIRSWFRKSKPGALTPSPATQQPVP